jgi:hypothetical protein
MALGAEIETSSPEEHRILQRSKNLLSQNKQMKQLIRKFRTENSGSEK